MQVFSKWHSLTSGAMDFSAPDFIQHGSQDQKRGRVDELSGHLMLKVLLNRKERAHLAMEVFNTPSLSVMYVQINKIIPSLKWSYVYVWLFLNQHFKDVASGVITVCDCLVHRCGLQLRKQLMIITGVLLFPIMASNEVYCMRTFLSCRPFICIDSP